MIQRGRIIGNRAVTDTASRGRQSDVRRKRAIRARNGSIRSTDAWKGKPRPPRRTIRRRKTLRYGQRDGRSCPPTCEWKQVGQTGHSGQPNRCPRSFRSLPEFHSWHRQPERPQPDPPPHAQWTRSATTSPPHFAPSAPRCPPALQRTERSRSIRLFVLRASRASLLF